MERLTNDWSYSEPEETEITYENTIILLRALYQLNLIMALSMN